LKVSSQSSNTYDAVLSLEDLRGVLLPITTPFDADGEIDLDGLRSNIAKWNATGISGYVILGSTGERVHLDEREYLEVIETSREAVRTRKHSLGPNKQSLDANENSLDADEHSLDANEDPTEGLTFIVGAGQQSTRGTINEIRRVSASVPVDAFLVITPHFYRSSITQQALIAHYESIADESPRPVILYSMPALTGIRIEAETTARLSEHKNIIGIKDSSADVEGLKATIKLVRKDFAVLNGNGTVFYQALTAGACGGILAVGCAAPALCIAIARAVESGDTAAAEMLQAKLTPLAEAVTTRFGIGGLKAALEMNGYVGGTVRGPLRMPDEAAREVIRRCLDEAKYEPPRQTNTEPGAVATGSLVR
jgi:4-hydroxy-2-oxoglutarate aldolase